MEGTAYANEGMTEPRADEVEPIGELAALMTVTHTLEALEPDARARVLRYANDRFGVKREPRSGGRRSR